MKIAILSRESDSYSTSRLREAAVARGHDVVVLDALRLAVIVETGASLVLGEGGALDDVDAVLPRIGTSITQAGTTVLRQLEHLGVFALNGADSIAASRDKLRALQLLARHDVPVATTVYARDRRSLPAVLERLGPAPFVVKLLEGTQGVGVMLAESYEMALSLVETLHFAKQNVLVQRFVRESRGRDVRAIVVGGRVVAAMRRMSKGREFRSNLHRGGIAEPVTLPPAYERAALRSVAVLGLRVAGVDMLEGEKGPLVIEVNSSPGLEGIETTTGVDVAGAMLTELEEARLSFSGDVTARLAIDPGYGLAELVVPPGSPLAGRSLAHGPLGDVDVRVLVLERGITSFPNPRADLVLEPGDRLVCHGRLASLRPYIRRVSRTSSRSRPGSA